VANTAHIEEELDPIAELAMLEDEVRRRRYRREPEFWAADRLKDTLWSKQVEIMRSVRDNRRTAVKSCHEIGKSFIAAEIVGWWLDIHEPGEAFVVTSAPSGPQVKAILWREIGRVHARGELSGRVNQTEWLVTIKNPDGSTREELVAFGRKPDEYSPTAFQGIHAPKVLVVFDEGCGIHGGLWEAADSLIANDTSKILVIGNPDDPMTEFYDICKPGSGYHVITVGAFDTPNFTGEALPAHILTQLIGRTYVEEKRKKWAPSWYWVTRDGRPANERTGVKCVPPDGDDAQDTNPLWQSKVLGLFPKLGDEFGLIPLQWIERARRRSIPQAGDHRLGLDVGGGGDMSTCAEAFGNETAGFNVRVRWEDRNPDTMQTCGRLLETLRETQASEARVDNIGIGRGIADRAKELKKPIEPISVSNKANKDEEFINLRAEAWWFVRTMFEKDLMDLDPVDEDTAAELASIRFKRASRGQIQIESKEEAKRRGVQSPNRADAIMLAVMRAKKKAKATWGRKRSAA
jgi:hypothetical protein